MLALVLALPYTTCFDPDMSGATLATPLIFHIRSECSMSNMFRFHPPIALTLPLFFAQGEIVRRLVPRELILPRILSVAHCPIARRTTTEKTPIIIPREESHALILLESIFFTAVFAVRMRFMLQKIKIILQYFHPGFLQFFLPLPLP